MLPTMYRVAPSSAAFTLTAPTSPLAAGAETTVTLRFTSSARGTSHAAEFLLGSDDPVVPEHFHVRALGASVEPSPTASTGTPRWVWPAIVGALVVGGVVGAVIAYEATKDDDEDGT